MTVVAILLGLFPILIFIGTGTDSKIMSRITSSVVGGMLTAPLFSLFVLPAAFMLLR